MGRSLIITPVHINSKSKRVKYLEDTLKSVSNNASDHLHLIVDDGSKYDVSELIRDFGLSDPRVRYLFRDKPEGELKTASRAINYGFFEGQKNEDKFGIDSLMVVHSDDLIREDCIKKMQDGLVGNELVYCNRVMFYEDGAIKVKRFGSDNLYDQVCVNGLRSNSIMWKFGFLYDLTFDSLMNNRGNCIFDPRIVRGEDKDVALETARVVEKYGGSFKFIDDELVFYRRHSDSIAGENDLLRKQKDLELMKSKHPILSEPKKTFYDFLCRPHTFLPEDMKKHLRPIQKYFFSNQIESERKLVDSKVYDFLREYR